MRIELIARSLAVFLGLFALGNISGDYIRPRFDANLWWIDLRFLPATMSRIVLFASGVLFLWFGLRPAGAGWRRNATTIAASSFALVAFANAAQFYFLVAKGIIASRIPIALSSCIGLGLVFIAWLSRTRTPTRDRVALGRIGVLLPVWTGLFPLLQTLFFGTTDYRRAADVAVVFGARAYANGQPSDALADRVRTACELYNDGVVNKLIFSGGPGDGEIDEAEAMRRMALSLGVSDQDIVTHSEGLNTEQTVIGTTSIFSQMRVRRILAVSHFYHLPRVKMAYQRHGWEVYTVPAKQTYFLRQIPYSMAREVAAFWRYYWRPLLSVHPNTV